MAFRHRVAPGECISSIAFRYGFAPDTIWNCGENAILRKLRGNPNVLEPGDEVFVPDKRTKTRSCATGAVHRFRRLGVPEKLRIRLLLADGSPRATLSYRVIIGTVVQNGVTDAAGWLEVWIPPDAMSGELVLDPDGSAEFHNLRIGRIDSIESATGLQSRLRNLGYYSGPINGDLAASAAALRRFQSDETLPVTGEADDLTRERLRERHGS